MINPTTSRPLFVTIDDCISMVENSIATLEQTMAWIMNGADRNLDIPANERNALPVPALMLRALPERLGEITRRIQEVNINLRGVFE